MTKENTPSLLIEVVEPVEYKPHQKTTKVPVESEPDDSDNDE